MPVLEEGKAKPSTTILSSQPKHTVDGGGGEEERERGGGVTPIPSVGLPDYNPGVKVGCSERVDKLSN